MGFLHMVVDDLHFEERETPRKRKKKQKSGSFGTSRINCKFVEWQPGPKMGKLELARFSGFEY